MDVRCKESRAAIPKGRPRPKRPGLAWAAGLLTVALAAIVALGATSARAANGYTWVTDRSTAGDFRNILGEETPINGRYAGRVWTDKSVDHDEGSDVFKTTFSALGSSRTIHSTTSNPLDVVFIVDVSGSMNEQGDGTARMAAATSALNDAIGQLMAANPNNRVAVTTFSSTGDYAESNATMLGLGRYERRGAQVSAANPAFSYTRNGQNTDNSELTLNASAEDGAAVSKTIYVRGGTNTQRGICQGMQLLADVENPTVEVTDAVTGELVEVQRIPAVVLLSDGAPTFSMNTGNWWDLANANSQVGPGNSSYYGNGMLAMMEASYQKGQINKAYGVDTTSGYAAKMYTVRVGSLTNDDLNLANVTLDPAQYLSADNSMSNGIRAAWETYRSGGNPAVLVDQTRSGSWWNPSYADVTVTLNHPSSDDITSLVYNDGAYVAGTDDLGSVFESIIRQLQQAAFSPVTDTMGGNTTPLTYSDPIGQYMAVTSVDSVELFGTTYNVRNNNDGTYSVVGNGTVNHPVYGTPVDVSKIVINVGIDGTGTEAKQTLTCQIPADILPVRVETITYAADGSQTFTSNRGEPAAQPLRLNYSVGFSDAVKTNGSVDLTKVSSEYKATHRNANGGIDFYSNTYNAKLESEPYADPKNPGTVGDATATFAPSKENRFYYFQANRTIFSDPNGKEGVLGEKGKVDQSMTLDSVDKLEDNETYYLIIDYHEGGESPRLVNYVVARTGAELKNSVEVVDGVVKTKIGAPRLGNTNRFTEVKAADATGIANATGTASLAYAPTYVYSDGEGGDYQVQVNLGNNGRVTVPETSVQVQKVVTAAEGITAPDQEFTFTVTASGRSDGEETLPVFELRDDGSWAQSVDGSGNPVTQKVVWAGGTTTVTLKAGQSVLVEMADGVQWTVTEDELGNQPANGTFSLTDREGTNGAAATEDNGRQIAGTAAAGSVQQAIFTNAYTTSTTWTTGTHGSILLTKDMEGSLASGDPRGFRVGDHFSFEVSPNEGAPLPRADKADGSGDFAVTSVEVGVAAVNTETGDDGGQRTTYDLEYVYRGADGEVSSQMVREKGLSAFSASFPGIVFDRPGDYVYTVRESRATAQNVVAGVTYDPSVYRFTVQVGTDASGSKLQVSGVSVEKRGADSTEYQPVDGYGANNPVTFVNEYRTTDVRRFFGVTKTLTGAPLAEGRFSFTLTGKGAHAMTDDEVAALPENGMTREQAAGYSYDGRLGQPMPDGVSGNTATTTNGAGGVVSFGGIRFEQASASVEENPTADDLRRGVVYKYTVVENVPEGATDNYLNGITYDTTSHDIYVYVHVEDSETEGEIVRSQVIYGHDHGTGDAGASSVPFTNSYSATGSATINGTKTMNGRTFRGGDTFTFTLSERSAATGAETVLQTKTLTVGAENEGKSSLPVSFDPISYIHNGTKSDLGLHTYVLREVEPDEGKLPGVSYDTAPRVVTVNVTDNGDGTLATPVTYPADADAVTWTNRYTAPTATVTLPGTKTFNGGPIPAQSFGFSTWTTGSDYNTEGVAPYQTWVGAGTSVDKDGTMVSTATVSNLLPQASYAPDHYYFVIAENVPENAGTSTGVVYDGTLYRVHLTVEDKFDGTAMPTIEVATSTDGGETWGEWTAPSQDGLAFTNTFEGVPQAVARLSKVTLNSTVPAEGYSFTLSIQRQDDSGQWVAAKASEVYVKDIDANADGTYSLKSDAAGAIPMGDLVFLREGTYRTALVEVLPNGNRVELGNGTAVVDGMAYDTHAASATYTVTRNGTSLVVRRDGADTLAFINDGGVPVSKTVYADGVDDAASLPQGPFTFKVSGLGEDQTAYLVVDGADEAVALTNGATFELLGGQSGRIYGLGQNGTIALTESAQGGFTADRAELTGSAVSGAAADGMAFRNKYTPGAASRQFSVSKELTGRGFKEGESFTFTLTGEGENTPMPTEDLRTATVRENNGKATFGEIAYDKVGTYTYTVQEKAGEDANGLKYDGSVYTVKVDVTYDEETKALKSTATYTKDGQPYKLVDGAMAFTNTYTSTGKLTGDDAAKLDVTKTLTGRDMTDGQFTFAVEPVDTDDAKASAKLGAVELHSVAAKAGEAAKAVVTVDSEDKTLGDLLGAVTFTQADAGKTFSWKVSENGTDKPAGGYTMDTAVYTVSIEVTDSGDGTVTATPSITKDGEAATAVAFTNAYNVASLTVPVTSRVAVSKELSGRKLGEGEFEFKLYDSEGNELATGKNAADGTVTFDRDLTFSAAGEYTYTVREVKGNLGGVTYDETVYSIVLTVTDNGDGALSVSRKEGTPESVTFKNTYESTGSMDGVASVNVSKVLTGRPLADGQFTFLVSPDDDDSSAKLPETSLTNEAAAAGKPAAAVSPSGKALSELFSAIKFDQNDAGKTFSWTVAEKDADSAPEGYKLDSSTHKVEVKVTDDGAGKITAVTSVDGTEATSGSAEVRFTNAYEAKSDPDAAEGSGRLTAKKELTGRRLSEGEFTFVMSDVKGNEVTTVTNKADGTVDFGAVQYTSAKALGDVANGIATMTTNEDGNPVYRYTYTLSEDESKLPELVTPSVSSIVVSVDVTDNGDGTMTCDVTWPESGSTFKNAYRAEDISLSITGAKVFSVPDGLDGVAAESLTGKFSFTLSDQDGNELHTATNDASGQVAFPAITYTQDSLGGAKERTFTYTVTETGSVPGITNDGDAKTVTVTLSQNDDGSLSARVGGEGPAFTFTNSYGVEELVSSVTDQISVKKTLGGRPMTEGEFNFKLVNAATGETVATGTNAADGTVELSPITYTEPGTYTYVLSEVAGDAPSVSYDDSEVTVTTTVTDKGDGRLEAKHVVDGGSVTFENIYSPKAANATLSVSKQLTGRDFLEGETFSFTLAAQDGAPMPAAGGETATVSENLQQAKFGAITFTKPGEYRYTISEVGGGSTKDGVAYDGSTFTAVVTVKDDTRTGRLEATVAYQNVDGATVTIPSFINRYTSTGSMDGVASVNVSKVLTGRPMAAGQFAFSVTPADDVSSAKLPAQTLTNQASDTSGTPAAVVTAKGETLSELFSGVTFTEADAGKTFAWTVAETSEAAPGYTVDATTYRVEVKVADHGNGTITATTYVNGDAVTGGHALIAFENGYRAESDPDAAEGSGRVTITKTISNRDLVADEFTFQMRDAKGAVVATVTNAADGTVDFGAVKYTSAKALEDVANGIAVQVGTADKPVYRYTYTLSEVTDALPENVSAEVPTVTVAVDVADNGDGTMTCTVVWPSDGAPTGFVNAYEADPVSLSVVGTKAFTAAGGLSVPDSVYGAFTFTLTDEAGNVLGTATNDRSGSVAFPEITYTQDDLAGGTERTFTYTVTETGSVPGVTNDAAPTRTVTVHLSQGKDGHLSTRVEGLPFTFTNTYSVEELTTSVTDQVKVTKTLTGRTLADGEFEFQLVGEDGEVAASGVNAADGTVTLSPVTYTEPGTYTYTLSEVQGDKPGVGYDDAVYTVTTTVVDDGDGTLSATHEVTGGEAVFNNTFTPSSVVDPDFGIPARKILVGRDWRDDDAFNFVVTAETENAPMPDPSSVFATAGSPMVHFGAVAFSEPGEYSYLVSEVAGDEEGMTYSQAVYRVRYEVTTDPVTGELQLDVYIHRIRDDAGADAADEWPFDVPLEFVNTYEAPEEPVVPEEPGTPEQPAGPVEKLPEPVKAVVLPITGLIAKTGDVVAPLLPWIGAGAAAVTAGVLRILKGGRRRED